MAENENCELTKKDRFEILLEDMNKNIKGIAEGHGILLAEVKDGNRKSEERDKELENMIKSSSEVLHKKIDDVKTELKQDIQKLDNRLIKVEQKVDVIDNRLIKVEQKVEVMDKRIEVLSDQQLKTDKKIDKLDEKMTIRQDKIEEKVDFVHQKVFVGH